MNDLLDLHTHTIASGHAYNTLKEMALAAAAKGLTVLGLSEHAPAMPGTCHEIYFHNLRVVDRHAYGVELLFGVELNILNAAGEIDLAPRALQKLDYAIASLHDITVKPASREENTAAMVNAMKNPYVKILGHPDDGHFALDYAAVVQAAKEYGVLIEVNNSSLKPTASRLNGPENLREILRLCKEYRASVIVNSDAHCEFDVGNHALAHALLAEADFPEALVVNASLERFRAFMQK